MGWSIALIENTVEVPSGLAEDLVTADKYQEVFYDVDDVTTKVRTGKGKNQKQVVRLHFNPDHMEHMDWVSRGELQATLCLHKVKGDILFGSLEGDNDGEFWGYRFDGKGGMKTLTGQVQWSVD
jgi:hypothetical protein